MQKLAGILNEVDLSIYGGQFSDYIDDDKKFLDPDFLRGFIEYNGKPEFAFEFIQYLLKNTKIRPFVFIDNKLRCLSSKGKELQFFIGKDLKHTTMSRGGFESNIENWSDLKDYDNWDNNAALRSLGN